MKLEADRPDCEKDPSGPSPAEADGDRLWDDQRLASPHSQADKAERVRRMFDAIAPTYELVNKVFSAGRDQSWRRKAVRLAGVRPGSRVLDVACGSGDFLRAFERWGDRPGRLIGADFSHNMLTLACERSPESMRWCEADAQRLPFDDESFDIASCAFGVRNFQELNVGLGEIHRVLAAGGRFVILEFTRPQNRVLRWLYEFYCGRIMPIGAAWISRDRTGAYRYLPQSVVSFAGSQELCDRLARVGFADVARHPLTFGAVTVYVATKAGR